jgi:hypothetical protein
MTARRLWLAVLGMGLLGSQGGHLVAYQMRFGAAAQQVQSTGAHAYFPLLARTTIGIVAIGLVACLFLIGLARILAGRLSARPASRPSFVGLVAVLFTLQLACFAGQEILEQLIAGAPVSSPAALLLWGALGQLPVAAVAALALGWILTRFEAAVDEIQSRLAIPAQWPVLVALAIPLWISTQVARLLSSVAGASLRKRGPPSSFSIGRH